LEEIEMKSEESEKTIVCWKNLLTPRGVRPKSPSPEKGEGDFFFSPSLFRRGVGVR